MFNKKIHYKWAIFYSCLFVYQRETNTTLKFNCWYWKAISICDAYCNAIFEGWICSFPRSLSGCTSFRACFIHSKLWSFIRSTLSKKWIPQNTLKFKNAGLQFCGDHFGANPQNCYSGKFGYKKKSFLGTWPQIWECYHQIWEREPTKEADSTIQPSRRKNGTNCESTGLSSNKSGFHNQVQGSTKQKKWASSFQEKTWTQQQELSNKNWWFQQKAMLWLQKTYLAMANHHMYLCVWE